MKVEPQIFKSYLAVISNSLGASTYKNFFALVDGEEKDILENGELSCAFYASSVLVMFRLVKFSHTTVKTTVTDMFRLVKFSHTTVKTTVTDMLESGWEEISEPRIGCVIVWEETDFGRTGLHPHIGFYMGNEMAVSHRLPERAPKLHNFTFDGTRKITKFLWHNNLQK